MHSLKNLSFLLTLCWSVIGQAQINDALFTVGTTTQGSDGRDWAYILWQSEDLDLLSSGKVAVYRKDGDADSPNSYTFEGLPSIQTSTTAIRALLTRGEQIGDDLSMLDQRIGDMFDIPLSGGLLLEDKVSAILQAAQVDARYFENVVLLSRLHPALSLCLGQSWASPVTTGVSTFEIRFCDNGNVLDPNSDCTRVIGRITVDSTAPVELPAPGPVVEVPIGDGSSVQRDLNLRMRWATPDDLRELMLLYFGFDVYRVSKTYAEAAGWDSAAPSAVDMLMAAELPVSQDEVQRVNRLPILIDEDLTIGQAADLSDSATFFHIDDNGRFLPGGEPFANGAQFYYYVAARDVLGRIGQLSAPSLVTICDRMPPPAPVNLSVDNAYNFDLGTNEQFLKVFWEAPELEEDAEASTIASYAVYRWESVDHFVQNRSNAAAFEIAVVDVSEFPDGDFEYLDNGTGAPQSPEDYGKTFVYTVRAIDSSACGGNFSPHSNTALGILRDRQGPTNFDTEDVIFIDCGNPEITDHTIQTENKQENDDPNSLYFNLSTLALDDQNLFLVEYWVGTVGSPVEMIGTEVFPGDLNPTEGIDYTILRSEWNASTSRFFARVFTYGNADSGFYDVSFTPAPDGTLTNNIEFFAEYELTESNPKPECSVHETVNIDGSINPVDFRFVWPFDAETYRLYRTVDDGPQTFVTEGSRDLYADSPIEDAQAADPNPPINAAVLCYYIQFFDVHGNPSALFELGCIETKARNKPPTPLLTPGESLGDQNAPIAKIRWLCSPYGVERFLLWISPIDLDPLDTLNTDELPLFFPAIPIVQGDRALFASFKTGRVGTTLVATSPGEFSVEFPVEIGVRYRIMATSLDATGTISDFSNEIEYTWTGEDFDGPIVPWPWRPVPSSVSTDTVDSQIVAEYFEETGVGIRFGDTFLPFGETLSNPSFQAEVAIPINTFVYADNSGNTIFPAVIYRMQVSNDLFPQVSGDVVQVSPMFELANLAQGTNVKGNETTYTILEPYIFVANDYLPSGRHGMYLADTNPVLRGAAYKYFILRFSETGEIHRILTTNTVTVPEQ